MAVPRVCVLLITVLFMESTSVLGSVNDCSFHAVLSCHPRAACLDLPDGSFTCKCPDNAIGDGMKGENHTGCAFPGERIACVENSTCHKTLGFCSNRSICECKVGFSGDGVSNCKDTDECKTGANICHENARCVNTQGSYECVCKVGYKGDGFSCNSTCIDDRNCKTNAVCNMAIQQCQCDKGYEGTPDNCTDINECRLNNTCNRNAVCFNLPGSYNCTCKPGLFGDGITCVRTPPTCQVVLEMNPKAKTGTYEIDPDGGGPLQPLKVYCIMRGKLGITVFETKFRMWIRTGTQKVLYNADLDSIRKVVDNSGFCYQRMSYKSTKTALLDGGTYWTDGTGKKQFNWGGSNKTGACLCRIIDYCNDPTKSCNNDGSAGEKIDSGKIIDKNLLPIQSITLKTKPRSALVIVQHVMCSSKPFDFPKDCHEAKYTYSIKQNESVFIDVDGPEGPRHPTPVFCQMTEEFNVGITIISHKQILTSVARVGQINITYMAPMEDIRLLIANSKFCMQEVKYECKNSGLMAGNASYWLDGNGVRQSYFAGALGESGKCGCGILNTCDLPDIPCNCDIKDGKTREDFGFIIDKSKLPVTALSFNDLPAGSSGRYTLGPLKCSQHQFGIKETCHAYRLKGYKSSYTYLIDPDGHVGKPPFPVYCQMIEEPEYGITVVHHHHNTSVSAQLKYVRVSVANLKTLITYSTYCKQSFTYTCKKAPLHSGANRAFPFSGAGGLNMASVKCDCEDENSCSKNMKCNCDTNDDIERSDSGTITWKKLLPISKVSMPSIGGTSKANLLVGPLMCYELRKNCYEIVGRRRLYSQMPLKSGFYAIDPDGVGGVPPFKVQCKMRVTFIDTKVVKNRNGRTTCYNVTYDFGANSEQVSALVKNSGFCTQKLIYQCYQNPATDHVYFQTCDGVRQKGWAGSNGMNMCACGVTGTCHGETGRRCNCDAELKQWMVDQSYIQDKSRLPVCQVCSTLKKWVPGKTTPTAVVYVHGLFCGEQALWRVDTCQQHRNNRMLYSGNYFLYAEKERKQVPIYCQMIHTPPTGILTIFPKVSIHEINSTGIDIIVNYFVLDLVYIKSLIESSIYCTQELTFVCNKSKLELTENYGWFSRDGVLQGFWPGNEGGIGCKGGKCNCDGNTISIDSGNLINKNLLPVSRVKLGPSDGRRTLKIGPLKCYNVYRDCDEIKRMNQRKNPLRNNIYSIDPDGAGGENLFAAKCDFATEKDIGITEVEHSNFLPKDVGTPDTTVVQLNYSYATVEQIHALVEYDKYCHQDVLFTCKGTHLINNEQDMNAYLESQKNQSLRNFGTGPFKDTIGCACKITNTCPKNKLCHCDALLPKVIKEGGVITAKESLPLRQANFKLRPQGGVAKFYASSVRCAPRPIDLPKDCLDAQKKDLPPGETFIQPTKSVDPFFVYCDREMVPGTVVTIIGNVQENRTVFKKDITITYHNVTYDQIETVIDGSDYCYQPVRLDCKKSMFIGAAGAYWFGNQNKKNQYFGSSDNSKKKCTCGMAGLCGGKVSRSERMKRACNCDSADQVWRSDGGVLSEKGDLPIRSLTVPIVPNSNLALTVGKLYCSDKPFDIDECELNFHDCHPNATCINEDPGFKCYCKTGFRGIGVEGAFPNGRDCPDDNECAMKMCPWSAHCTNLPGTFKCTCRDGFKQTGPLTCEDIDECADGTHNCDLNAKCVNTEGGFFCRCKRNFRGNGTAGFCESIGICQCFGDPHCVSFDSKWLHFQGKCKYVMATDKCPGNGVPTFEVQALFWDGLGPGSGYTWVKEVTVIIGNSVINLLQNKLLQVDGVNKHVPHRLNDNVMIRPTPKFLEVITSFGLKVSWDGSALVEVKLPRDYINKTCGLCGKFNHNPADDWTIGTACNEKGPLTENLQTFGQSWLVTNYNEGVNTAECIKECDRPGPAKQCDPEKELLAKYLCAKIERDFVDCFEAMEPEMLNQYRFSCIYDLCHISANTTEGICQFLSALLNECQVNMKLNTYSWRSYCPKKCGRNQDYKVRQKVSDSKTCLTVNQAISDAYVDDLDSSSEGCFCRDGFVMQDNECIKEEDCGCIFNNTYYPIGTGVVTEGCQKYAKCGRKNSLIFKPLKCSADAECGVQDGTYGCHCKKGFVGDGLDCSTDYCTLPNMNCTSDAKCVSGDKSFYCVCAEGYNTYCDRCEDIDECKTGTHKCDAIGFCVNTVGSYTCHCPKGYYLDGKKCKDLDECEMNTHNCVNNSRCFNKPGSFDCLCCAGYTKERGQCVASGVIKPEEQAKCCACYGYVCSLKGTVCGTDAETYKDMAALVVSACEKGKTIKLDYRHKCAKSCGGVKCPKYQVCEMDAKTGKPTCKCEPCSKTDNIKTPVCSQVNVIYNSMCEFKQFQCKFNIEQIILDPKQCKPGGGSGAVGEWSPWSACSVTCGKGTKTRKREALRTLDDFEKNSLPRVASADCYGDPCTDGVCANLKCKGKFEQCVVVDGRPKCECPTCKGEGKDPVCARIYVGKLAYTEQTLKNPCDAKRVACLMGNDMKLIDEVACGLLPVNCSYVANFMNVTDGDCVHDGEINIGKCVGGCGMDTGHCCDVVAYEKVTVNMKCPNGRSKQKQLMRINKCQCVEQKRISSSNRLA